MSCGEGSSVIVCGYLKRWSLNILERLPLLSEGHGRIIAWWCWKRRKWTIEIDEPCRVNLQARSVEQTCGLEVI